MIPDDKFDEDGFTKTGKERFEKTIDTYAQALYDKSVRFGAAHQAKDLSPEVTHEHVRQAADTISNSSHRKPRSAWSVFGQAAEYFCSAGMAYGLANLKEEWGPYLFFVSMVSGAVLFLTRIMIASR